MKFRQNLIRAQFCGQVSVFIISVFATVGSSAAELETIDDLSFNAVTDESLFSSGFQIEGKSTVKNIFSSVDGATSKIKTNLDIENIAQSADNEFGYNDDLGAGSTDGFDNLSDLTSSYQSQGLKIKRLSSSWQTEAGALTVGNDWANFQDFLSIENGFKNVSSVFKNRTVASQIKWFSPNGFSLSLEGSPRTSIYDNFLEDDSASSSLILSWQGGPGGVAGEYRVTALGKKFDAETSGQSFDAESMVGWGLNLEGGWQIGDLFAALSVTFGKGINSYVLQRFGNDLVVTPNDLDYDGGVLGVRPSLYYSLNDKSNFHVALGHYSAEESFNSLGIDTLDTIHMGYSWSPWPSTKFGLELVGQNADGRNGIREESTQFKFGAEKIF